jgi:hypothetical protein
VNPPPKPKSATKALDECDVALIKLDKTCCDPGRSPQMATLAGTLTRARSLLEQTAADPTSASRAIAELEDAGAQVGRLQVGCCAPNRMPLYITILGGLTEAQLRLNASLDLGH